MECWKSPSRPVGHSGERHLPDVLGYQCERPQMCSSYHGGICCRTSGLRVGFSPEPNLVNHNILFKLLEPQSHHLQHRVIILSSSHTAMKTKCKVDYYFLNCNMLSTHKQLSRVGNTFLLVGREASELWKRQIGVSGVY